MSLRRKVADCETKCVTLLSMGGSFSTHHETAQLVRPALMALPGYQSMLERANMKGGLSKGELSESMCPSGAIRKHVPAL